MIIIDIFMFLILSGTITTVGALEIYKNIEKKYYMEAADKGFKEASDAPKFLDDLLFQSFSTLPKMLIFTYVPFLNLIVAINKSILFNKEKRLKLITNGVRKHWLIEMNEKEKEYYQRNRTYNNLQTIKSNNIEDKETSKKIDDILHGDVVITESDVDLFRVIKTNRWPNRYLELKEKIKAIKDLELDSNKENELIMEILKSYRQEDLIDNENINNDSKVKKLKR